VHLACRADVLEQTFMNEDVICAISYREKQIVCNSLHTQGSLVCGNSGVEKRYVDSLQHAVE